MELSLFPKAMQHIMEAVNINPLANPKGRKLLCELCGKPAYIQCKNCRLTYYCDVEHESIDFRGIHEKICQLLIPLRTPDAVFGSQEERKQRQITTRERQIQLLEITKIEAHKKLFEGHFELAIPAALQALRFSMEVYGADSIELVPSYLLLGEASIGLRQYTQAEDYLSLAKWAVLKVDSSCHPAIRAQLYRNLGLLFSSKGDYEESLKQLANDIYFSSLSTHPDHINVSGGYYNLGNVFQKQNRIDEAASVFDKVISIWKATLKDRSGNLNEAQQAEAVQILTTIHSFRTVHLKSNLGAAEVMYVIGQLYHHVGNMRKCRECVERSLEIYEKDLGREHSTTVEVKMYFKGLMETMKQDSGASEVAPPRTVRGGSILA